MLSKGDLIVNKWADFLEDFVICKVIEIKELKKFSDEWYQYAGAIFDYSKDCNLITSEIVYSADNKWKTGLTLYIIEDEALTLDEYLKLNVSWEDYLEYKSKYEDLF